MCYTSDLQTSPIFTVDYYKGVAKSAAEAGAHMIGIKVSELTTTRQQSFFCIFGLVDRPLYSYASGALKSARQANIAARKGREEDKQTHLEQSARIVTHEPPDPPVLLRSILFQHSSWRFLAFALLMLANPPPGGQDARIAVC